MKPIEPGDWVLVWGDPIISATALFQVYQGERVRFEQRFWFNGTGQVNWMVERDDIVGMFTEDRLMRLG